MLAYYAYGHEFESQPQAIKQNLGITVAEATCFMGCHMVAELIE